MTRKLKVGFVGDVITQPMRGLGGLASLFNVEITHEGIGQFHQVLSGDVLYDVLIVHTTSDYFLEGGSFETARQRVDDFCQLICQAARSGRTLFIINTIAWQPQRRVGQQYFDELRQLAELNSTLHHLIDKQPMVSMVDLAGVLAAVGHQNSLRQQSRLVMRMPYTKPALDAIGASYRQAIAERFLPRSKVVVLDADNTLWGGIIGEDGVHGIAIDHEYPGSVYWEFQSQLSRLRQSGLLLAMVSKNNEADVREVFDKRSMPLRWGDFSALRVNWDLKSANISAIAEELSLGLDSFVFIDDNPFEIEEVRAACPAVQCFQFDGKNADSALTLLSGIASLQTWAITAEDKKKAELYATEALRRDLKTQSLGFEDYLASLKIEILVGRNRKDHFKRIAQLTNKTNQFNLTTRRYSEAEMLGLMESDVVFDFQVRDRFGDMGIVAVVIVKGGDIDTFLMSCRVLGRKIESTVLSFVCSQFEGAPLTARYVPSLKNKMVENFYEDNGFEALPAAQAGAERVYRLGCRQPIPPTISIIEIS